jgi:arylsulfatase A-like enzyme
VGILHPPGPDGLAAVQHPAEWLARQPKDAPVFCVINLCDTHEPYFAAAGAREGLAHWWRIARVRQDFVRCISGSWKPTVEELRTLRALYREMVRNLDRRLRGIVEAFRQAGRWENTSLIATSDQSLRATTARRSASTESCST